MRLSSVGDGPAQLGFPGQSRPSWASSPDRAEGDVALRRAHKGQPSHYIERLALRTGRFCLGGAASYAGGEMLTRPLRFSGGGS